MMNGTKAAELAAKMESRSVDDAVSQITGKRSVFPVVMEGRSITSMSEFRATYPELYAEIREEGKAQALNYRENAVAILEAAGAGDRVIWAIKSGKTAAECGINFADGTSYRRRNWGKI